MVYARQQSGMNMHHFIDRRKNPKGKSTGNRQRFLKRARAHIKRKVEGAVSKRGVSDILSGETITIPTKGIGEPQFRHDPSTGKQQRIFPGNKEFDAGDELNRPPKGDGGSGKQGSDDGDGLDEFEFTLTREEFLDFLFDDMELPNLVKRDLVDLKQITMERAGISVSGTPANFNVLHTMRNAQARRVALGRPPKQREKDLVLEIKTLEEKRPLTDDDRKALDTMRQELTTMRLRRKRIPFVDPSDVRYNHFRATPKPITKAVMFCLMDVSASMQEREKNLAKRFFILLHLFLHRRYETIDLVFIRHTHVASEVDENTFFHDRESGGTIVSTVLRKMNEVINERYSPDNWNIYAAQASDGENFQGDSLVCEELICDEIMPLVQYFAYIEIVEPTEMSIFGTMNGAELWSAYKRAQESCPHLAITRIGDPSDIYPVFRELFTKPNQVVK
jgi:uncharacterized sporulation protein YeaH/YhbH (DUF444 family)